MPATPSRHLVRRARLLAGLAVGALFTSLGVAAPARADTSVPGAPTSLVATQAGVAPDLDVSWTPAASGSAATGAMVQLYDMGPGTPSYVATDTCANDCTGVVFRSLTLGDSYEALLWPSNSNGYGPPTVSSQVTLADACSSGACVFLDATHVIGPANRAANGFLHSLYPVGSDRTNLMKLGATMWRSAPTVRSGGRLDWSSWSVAQKAGVPTTLVLSDLWSGETGPVTPWSNWSRYAKWVRSTVQSAVASGHAPTYWEPYNEPGSPGYYSSTDYATVTPDLLLQQFKVTYQAIKAVLPGAKIIGPSLERWMDSPVSSSSGYRGFDMVTFLNYAAANDLQLAAVSWHDIADFSSGYPGENTLSPQNLVDEVGEARHIIGSLPTLGSPKIFINEYEMPEVTGIPGWDVAYLSAITDAGVDSAVLTCWAATTCATPTLDGLLSYNAIATLPDYWVRLRYAQMSGSMIATASTDDAVSAVGSYNPGTSSVSALIGRGAGCVQNAWCASSMPSAVLAVLEPVTVRVTVPWSSGSVKVAGSDIAGQVLGVLKAPNPLATQWLSVAPEGNGTGTVSVRIPAFADGDAYNLTLTRA